MITIKQAIKDISGKTPICLEDLVDTWEQWYKGNVAKFHSYKAYNGKKRIPCRRRTLNMPKKVCEDWANLLLNEKTDVAYGDDEQKQALWDLLNKVEFWQKGNEGIEKTFALGNGAFVESYDNNGKEVLQFVNGKKIYPLTIEHDRVTECAFVNVNSKTTVLQIHLLEDEQYVIYNAVYEKQKESLGENIGELADFNVFETGSKLPWFQIVKPNIANNININSPMGISIFANAIDVLEGVDLAYDGFCEEMRLGTCKTFVNSKLVDYIDGQPIFDENETGYYLMGNGEDAQKEPLKFYNPTLRTESYFNGINNALNLLSSKCGFGENHYRFDKGGVSTATQVISENSEMFRTLKKHEILLNDVIIGVCKALMYIHNNFTDDQFKFDLEANIEVKFDDSIIEDKETQKNNDRADVSMGVMSDVEYRMKWFNEDRETATRVIEEIRKSKQGQISNFFSEE